MFGNGKVRHEYSGTVEVHYYYHQVDEVLRSHLDKIDAKLERIIAQNTKREGTVTVQLDALKAQVQGIPDVVGSAVTLLNGIVTRLEAMDAAEDATVQAQIDQIVQDIRMNVQPLADAVAANTPAEPAPEPPPAAPTEPNTAATASGPTPAPFAGGTTGPSGGAAPETGGTTGASDTGASGAGGAGEQGAGTPPPA